VWLAAVPECLVSTWEATLDQWESVNADVSVLADELIASIPEPAARIRSLLHWFGSGAGPWSGFPGYEEAPELLLLEEDLDVLIAVAQFIDLTPSQLEGAARLFGGWSFSKRYPDGAARLSESLKTRLWNQVKDTEDIDKRGRAERAFL
jgi:hypothetical protein